MPLGPFFVRNILQKIAFTTDKLSSNETINIEFLGGHMENNRVNISQ